MTVYAEPETENLELSPPEEPLRLKLQTRAELEGDPPAGNAKVKDARFLAQPLWRAWGGELRARGMQRRHFFAIARGYSAEIRLWVVGERPWEHCVSGLAGRVRRRLETRE
ncbi:hypothetical protein [Rubrobacter indicoceani]|uniref:hypothetical protein n=1 Tax=Rubrobacter indicoceani TaxID=2051957 RepID=UPI000E5BF05E|nr:hypothetical protein [Rubrobacter indicoceani]